ncbi:MAG TPA: hypothetical protein VEL07_20170 [Planctomycetota bacterium]|nr:hypothetical protein [Planctomycetota bacterium]
MTRPLRRDAADIVIRDVRGADELRACQALQRRAWGITEDGYLLPVATMIAAQKMGGVVLGAIRGTEVVGFSFAFLGRLPQGDLTLFSQLTAVDPQAQGGGIGRLLKLEQRARAAAMGLASISWTFDPLQAGNAAFNLDVLGAVGRVYEADMYGARTDALNAGLATDRLLVRWATAGGRVAADPAAWSAATALIDAGAADGVPVVRAIRPPAGPRLRLPIPPSIAAVKAAAAGAARDWQAAVRASFTAAFAAGYAAIGFARDAELPCYLLEREPA